MDPTCVLKKAHTRPTCEQPFFFSYSFFFCSIFLVSNVFRVREPRAATYRGKNVKFNSSSLIESHTNLEVAENFRAPTLCLRL
jgi:hypothetical protein